MRRCLAELLSLLLLAGCAFEDGDPWGEAQVALVAGFDPGGRLEAGRLQTTNDYRVELTALRITVDAVTLRMAAGEGAATFDPADPPAGYSLCHNGHCHHDSGRLVPYEEIEIELAEQGGGGAAVTLPAQGEVRLDPAGGVVEVALSGCPDGCSLERGRLATVEVVVAGLYVEATIHDPLARLDAPLAIAGSVPLSTSFTALADARVDRGEPVEVRLGLALRVTEKLFDGVDWADLAAQDGARNLAGAGPALAERLEAETHLELDISR